MSEPGSQHAWPTRPGQHFYGPWHIMKGSPRAQEYRQCVHPNCSEYETREVKAS